MNFQDTEKTYADLRTQHNAGKLSDADFEAEVGKLKLQDDQGRWWMIGVQSGEWYMHDGQKWTKGKPPIPATAPAPTSSVTPINPDMSRKPVEKTKPMVEDKAKPGADDKAKLGGGLPARLFSAKPAGREGGRQFSRNTIIGIVAAVVVVLLICVAVGVFVVWPMISGQGATARTTPTVAFVAKASPTGGVVIPTLAPISTNTPVIAPTVPLPPSPISTTVALTSTTSSSASASSKVAGPTATKKPSGTVTPTKPPLSPTPAAPPGVYVTKIVTDPPAPDFGQGIGFRVTFFNNTGSVQHYNWKVKIFKCSGACTSDDLAINKSIGESIPVDSNVALGSSEQYIRPEYRVGGGVCTLVLNVYYFDNNTNLVPFTMPDGKQLFQNLNMCR